MNGTRLSGPQRLLLATDLSARCDRPLERAKQLAGEWQAPIVVLTVREMPQAPGEVVQWLDVASDEAELAARREIALEFSGSGLQPRLCIADGEVSAAILDAAARLDRSIVITGTARNETLGRLFLGSTVERLARGLSQPLLVVRRRARGAYRRILVAADFTDASRLALETAATLFPGREMVVFHAHQAGLEALADQAAPDAGRARAECERFLDTCRLPAGVRGRIVVVTGEGLPETLLGRYVREHDIELAVLGLHSRAGLVRVLMGSRGERLLRDLMCDILVVGAGKRDGDA